MKRPFIDRLAIDVRVAKDQSHARRGELVCEARVRRWAIPFWLVARGLRLEVQPRWLGPLMPAVVFLWGAWAFWWRRDEI